MSQEDGSKGFTGSRLKMAKKKAPEPFKSTKSRINVQHEGLITPILMLCLLLLHLLFSFRMQGRNQVGKMCASFTIGNESNESSPRANESHLTIPGMYFFIPCH